MNADAQDLLAEVVANHWQVYRKRLRECRRQPSEEALHKLRISLRRLLALVDLLQAITSPPKSNLRKQLKAQLTSVSELRDIQVSRLEISLLVSKYPQLQGFLHQLHLRELALLIALPELIASWRSGKLQRKLNKIVRIALRPDSFTSLITSYLDRVCQLVAERQSQLDSSDLGSFHKLRIAIKRLRYSLELTSHGLLKQNGEQIEHLKRYQDLLGDIQNNVVLLTNLETAGDLELLPLLRQSLIANRQQLLSDFTLLQQHQPLADFQP